MLIVTALNVTEKTSGHRLVKPDGTADYKVWVGVNTSPIWEGSIEGHVRDKGASELLRMIADRMDENLGGNDERKAKR